MTPDPLKDALAFADSSSYNIGQHAASVLALAYRESQAALAEKEATSAVIALADRVLIQELLGKIECAESALEAARNQIGEWEGVAELMKEERDEAEAEVSRAWKSSKINHDKIVALQSRLDLQANAIAAANEVANGDTVWTMPAAMAALQAALAKLGGA